MNRALGLLVLLLVLPAAATAGEGIPYACPDVPASPHPRAGAVAAFVDAWRPFELSEEVKPTPALRDALVDLAFVDPDALTVEERIWAQNIAFSIAVFTKDPPLRRIARRLVEVLALERAALEALGSDPARLEPWLGERASWIERAGPSCGEGPLIHERVYRGTRAFRPISTRDRRALVHQLVAIDTEGRAHVTPVVAEVELRLGHGSDAPACIVEGAPGSLANARVETLTLTIFVRPSGDRLGCNACHRDASFAGFADVTGKDAKEIVGDRLHEIEAFATAAAAR